MCLRPSIIHVGVRVANPRAHQGRWSLRGVPRGSVVRLRAGYPYVSTDIRPEWRRGVLVRLPLGVPLPTVVASVATVAALVGRQL